MAKLILASAQYPITHFTDHEAWQAHVRQWVNQAAEAGANLLLFPEYGAMELTCLLPYGVQNDLSAQIAALEAFRPDFIFCFERLAREAGVCVVAPSFPVQEGEGVYNRSYVFGPEGLAGYQDKFFMTRFENESWGIDPAEPILALFEAEWGSFGIQTCYDVEFPVGSALLCGAGAELILAPSCTETIRGAARVHTGAQARALENQCFVAVAQTVGNALWSPAVDINYGYAAIYGPPDLDMPELGIIAAKEAQQAGWLVQALDFEAIRRVREMGQVFNFKDHQRLKYELDGKEPTIKRCLLNNRG